MNKKHVIGYPVAVILAMTIGAAGASGSSTAPVAAESVPAVTVTVTSPAPKPAAPKPAAKPKVVVPVKPTADASAQLSCEHFHNVMSDFIGGILTTVELRSKIQEVYDTASVSENAGIPDGARSLLASATADNGPAFLASARVFTAACEAVGL